MNSRLAAFDARLADNVHFALERFGDVHYDMLNAEAAPSFTRKSGGAPTRADEVFTGGLVEAHRLTWRARMRHGVN